MHPCHGSDLWCPSAELALLERRELSSRKHNVPSIFFFGAKLGTTHWHVSCMTSCKNKLRACRNGFRGKTFAKVCFDFVTTQSASTERGNRFRWNLHTPGRVTSGAATLAKNKKWKMEPFLLWFAAREGGLLRGVRPLCIEIYNENKSRPSHYLLKKTVFYLYPPPSHYISKHWCCSSAASA